MALLVPWMDGGCMLLPAWLLHGAAARRCPPCFAPHAAAAMQQPPPPPSGCCPLNMPTPNTIYITVRGSGMSECDGVYFPSTQPPKKSESGTVSTLGYWNGKKAWDREGCARNPALSYSGSYNSWRIARGDGHLAYSTINGQYDTELPPEDVKAWEVYKKGQPPIPTITIHQADPRGAAAGATAAETAAAGDTAAAAAAAAIGARAVDVAGGKQNVVFVLGGPGAGKGTMCELAANQLGWTHFSAGELLRAERASGSENAALIQEYILAGKIVPVTITVGLVKRAMDEETARSGRCNFLIDGFPRSPENWSGWQEVFGVDAEMPVMLFFECPLPVLEQRILGRAKYSGRSDDNIESLRKRFNTYKSETLPIVEVFRAAGKCIEVDSSKPREEVYALVTASLEPWSDPAVASQALSERSEMLLGLRPFPKKIKKLA
jgi:UMP-CMP kinase